MSKKICYLDMDGVVVDFEDMMTYHCPRFNEPGYFPDPAARSAEVDRICEENTWVFKAMKPMEGALEAVGRLSELYDVYFLSTPMWNVPDSYTGKRLWIEKHFPELGVKKLILTHRKDLNAGDFLVDDRIKHGVDAFKGEHVHFGTDRFPDWQTTLKYLEERA